MPWLNALRQFLGRHSEVGGDAPHERRSRIASAWGLNRDDLVSPTAGDSSEYDAAQWLKRLKRVLSELPATELEWPELVRDARAKGFGNDWARKAEIEEFRYLVRQSVADGLINEFEHKKLELARSLIGLDESEAAAIVQETIAEAESIFGKPIEGA